ncbi:MAG: hypothetical protein IJG42_10985 [Muribaculaceae bacterium]|nr:hypothetical protein [Muribaculaceae bacterium]
MNDKKNTAATTSKKASRDFLQGRMLSLEFFKRNWVYAVFIVAMALAYIGNKFACQRSIQELLSLKTDLANAQTDLVNASAQYNSMIRESEMVKLMNQRNLGLTAPLDPPYELKSK